MVSLRALLSLGLACFLIGCGGERENRPSEFSSNQMVLDLPEAGQEAVQTALREYCGTPASPKLLGELNNTSSDQLVLGRKVYESRCVPCHGYSGDGNGPAAEFLWPRPRDYRQGTFKFTSTLPEERATREDIKRVITQGAPGTAMPSFRFLPKEEIEALATYVLALTLRGELEVQLALDYATNEELDPDVVEERVEYVLDGWRNEEQRILRPDWNALTEYSEANILKGREFFLDFQKGCVKCHGPDGKGSAVGEVGKDDWGYDDAAANLTSGLFHGGGRPEDIYRRIYAGVKGSPMPSFQNTLGDDPERIWNIAHYVRFLADQARRNVAAQQLDRQAQQASGLLQNANNNSGAEPTADSG